MAERQQEHRVGLFSDVPGDEQKVRAILADWGLPEEEIGLLLSDERPRAANTPRQQTPPRPRPAAPRRTPPSRST
jgi:hypothetical protein